VRNVFGSISEIEGSLRAAGVRAADAAALAGRAKPYVWLDTAPVEDEVEIPLGGTKIGGAPDLPVAMPWPWRPPYPDHDERLVEARSGADEFNARDLMAIQAETLEEFRKLMPPEQFEAAAAAFAQVDMGQFNLSRARDGSFSFTTSINGRAATSQETLRAPAPSMISPLSIA
jgi:hypothetical protein